MKTLQTIFNKIAENKTELETHKVELGIVDDLKKELSVYNSGRKNLDNELNDWYDKIFKIKNEFNKIKTTYTKFEKPIKGLKSTISKLEKQAKELGINAKEIKGYNDAKAAINTSDDMVGEFFEANRINKSINI